MRTFVAKIVAAAIAVALTAGVVALPVGARAQGAPSYGRPAAPSGDETIHGRIESIEGSFAIVVRDDRGFLDAVALHQGTIINPRGLRLAPGMSVTIIGFNAGASFSAVEIDAPYASDEYGATNYDAYGYGYDYGLASAIDLGLGIVGGYGDQVVQPVAPVASPKPGATRGIEHPTPGHPVRHPLADPPDPAAPAPSSSAAPSAQASAAPNVTLPSYAMPLVMGPQLGARVAGAYRNGGWPTAQGPGAQSRGTVPESRGSAPDYRTPPAPRSAPAPARSESAPARSESAPARSAPASSRSH
jgi:hypothetical protein